MKLTAKIDDVQYIREFQSIMMMLTKLCKECVLDISKDKIHFIVNEEVASNAPLVWVEIDAKLYFSKFVMEGVTKENPRIKLLFAPSKFMHALASQRSQVHQIKMQLVNLQFPCLTITVDIAIPNSENLRTITNHLPVDVLSRVDWSIYELPQVHRTKLTLKIPSSRLIRGLVEKLKNLSPSLIFYATSKGELNLVTETEMSTITTRYRKLKVLALNVDNSDEDNRQIEASCAVDSKKTCLFFTALQVPTLELTCGIADDHLVDMEVDVRDGITIHSVLPALCV